MYAALGCAAGAIYAHDIAAHDRLVRVVDQLVEKNPPVTQPPPGDPWPADAALRLASFFWGILGRRGRIPSAFIRRHAGLHRWIFKNASALPLGDDLRPSHLTLHITNALVRGLVDPDCPGQDVAAIAEDCPPTVLLEPLRLLAQAFPVPDSLDGKTALEVASAIKRTWSWAMQWVSADGERKIVAGIIGTWATQSNLVEAVGADWLVSCLEKSLELSPRLDDPDGVLSALTAYLPTNRHLAPRILSYVHRLREVGLLRGVQAPTAENFLNALTATQGCSVQEVRALQGILTAERVIGPLSTLR
jgi:hypothetical protein